MTISESAEKIEQLRNKIKIELLPKDANDDKNIIMKIRGAAGGDETNIFLVTFLECIHIMLIKKDGSFKY